MLRIRHKKPQVTKKDITAVSKAVNSCKIAYINNNPPNENSEDLKETTHANLNIFDKNHMLFVG